MGKTVNLLHLSDLHFGMEATSKTPQSAVDRRNLTLKELTQALKGIVDSEWRPDVVAITGDIAWAGKADDYKVAAEWINDTLLPTLKLGPERMVICPGNHDIDRFRTIGIDPPSSQKKADEWLKLENLENFERPFNQYTLFCRDKIKVPAPKIGDQKNYLTGVVELNDLCFVVLNSAWFCRRGDQDQSRLWLGKPLLETLAARDQLIDKDQYDQPSTPITIALFHHPHELLNIKETWTFNYGQKNTVKFLYERVHLILNGHFHARPDPPDRPLDAAWRVIGGASYENRPYQNHFSILKIDTEKRAFCRQAFEYDPGREQWLPFFEDDAKKWRNLKKSTGEAPPVPVVKSEYDDEITAYLEKAETLHANLPVAGFATQLKVPIDVEEIYIPLRAMVDLGGVERECFADAAEADKLLRDCRDEISLPQAFEQFEGRRRRGIVILGDPGAGKTTHLKRLLLGCIRRGPEAMGLPEGMVPVFLPLRELNDLEAGLDAFIESQLDNRFLQTPDGFGRRLLERGNLLFLFDGLDEVAELSQREAVTKWITAAVRSLRPNCRYVVTSRYAGYSPSVHLNEDFLEMHIRPLTGDQMADFIHNWYGVVEKELGKDPEQSAEIADQKAEALITRLKDPDFRARRVFELSRNPLLLTNICLVHRHRGALPQKRARLYEECIDVLLEHWRGAKGLPIGLTAQEGRRALQPAAYWLHGEEGPHPRVRR